MSELILPLLVLLLVVALGNLAVAVLLWWRHIGLVSRVTRLEVYQETNLTHAESRQIHERLSSMEGQILTTNRLLQTVQEHLLENDSPSACAKTAAWYCCACWSNSWATAQTARCCMPACSTWRWPAAAMMC